MGTMTDDYRTPEGFTLHRPLLMPDVRDFAEVLIAERRWNFATMNHKNGRPQTETPAEVEVPGRERTVSRFCSVRNLPGRYHMQVSPTTRTLELISSDDFAFFDRVSFEAIYHPANDRVLIVADASQIIASRYLAYVDPATVPTFEEDNDTDA